MTERTEDLQLEALRAFTVLGGLRHEWRGALVLACGLGTRGSALAIAANIAGAGCLAIDPRPEMGRAVMRSGACDFVVNTVDEALRILKNEIRQKKPVSVGLTLGIQPALEELAGRGVRPDLFAVFADDGLDAADADVWQAAAGEFARMGSEIVSNTSDADMLLESLLQKRKLQLVSFPVSSAEELRRVDARLSEVMPADDSRGKWCATAPRFFHRERPHRRVVFLSAGELSQLTDLLGESQQTRP